ncbi:MAG: DUF1679 domain-containing protein [Methylococcales bacterium]|jgi:hypothetical protein|nr:DUF1679 domain-containing protein [Methylococcales bacterium]MBT7410202.1 DUF1679 domain-containing protein [Methylococcales bacterium]
MNHHFETIILNATGASTLTQTEMIQSLWSGYGEILRYKLTDSRLQSVVVKHVRLPDKKKHPRGWNTDLSHARKVKSYRVEMAWYQQWNQFCDESCLTADCLALETQDDEVLMVLEDLDQSGYPARKSMVSNDEINQCLSWLANFHATFLGKQPTNLWPLGTYWHLETRPDELNALNDSVLKKAAHLIDQKLQDSPFQTFVHGDAKLANFCFSADGKKVAAVDFQYVGGGCGMKDVGYFLGSCLDENESQQLIPQFLEFYFQSLKKSLISKQTLVDFEALEANWRDLFPLAWTDFHRFLKGWSPGHWKINDYSERVARSVLENLKNEI